MRAKCFITFIIALVFCCPCNAQPYKYLALKGGGIRGIAYIGAMKVLEEKNMISDIEKVAGTSIGAVVGVMICTGLTANEMEDKMQKLDITTFNDGSGYFIGGQRRMKRNFGWYKGNNFERWITDIIVEQTGNENTTFRQLHELAKKDRKFKDLYVTATNLTQQRLEIFSWETHPDMPIRIAIRASVSIPLYYGAVFIDSTGKVARHPKKGLVYNVYVDGGLMANYPIITFNTEQDNAQGIINKFTLGLKLERPEQIEYQHQHKGLAPYTIHTLRNYVSSLYNITIEQLNPRIPYEAEQKQTIYISTSNMNPRVRHISSEQKKLLFTNGIEGAHNFFEPHSN